MKRISMEQTSLIISIISLVTSSVIFWLHYIDKGTLKMTRPTMIFLGPDGFNRNQKKIVFRALLYSTAHRGHYIENMHVLLKHSNQSEGFTNWIDKRDGESSKGGGLFVGKEGVVLQDHFLNGKTHADSVFKQGENEIGVFIEIFGQGTKQIYTQKIMITSEEATLANGNDGLLLNRDPIDQHYISIKR